MEGLFVQKHAEAVSLYSNVVTLYVQPDKNIYKSDIKETNEKGFTEIRVYFPISGHSVKSRIFKQLDYLKAYYTGFRYLQKTWGKPDIIQVSIFTRTALIAVLIKLSYGIPFTVIEHWTRYFRQNTFHNRFHKLLSIYAAKQASAIMPVTHHLQKCMESHGMKNHNYHVINNVVDDIFFESLANPGNNRIRILNVTCFDDTQKNLSGLLNVVQLLYQKRQDFEIYLIGDGVDFEKIRSFSRNLNLENKVVFFTGLLTGKELVEAYQQSHFTVLFSNYENIPVVISESLACGIPVVTTNVGGIAEHINKSNGILIEAKDEQALFNSLDYMLDHYSDYNKAGLIEAARIKYSYQSVGKELVNIYSTILQK